MHIPYTICFVQQDQKVLMIHRTKEPNKGKWNGVGGKIEPGEPPMEACRREIREETGLRVKNLTFRGVATFRGQTGMYVYIAEPITEELIASEEGEVAWKSLLWAMTSEEAASTIPYYLPEVLGVSPPVEHAFYFTEDGTISSYETKPLKEELHPVIE